MVTTELWVSGAALAASAGAAYAVCAAAVALFADGTLAFFDTWAHGAGLTLVKRPAAKPLAVGEWTSGSVSIGAAGHLASALHGRARNLSSAWK